MATKRPRPGRRTGPSSAGCGMALIHLVAVVVGGGCDPVRGLEAGVSDGEGASVDGVGRLPRSARSSGQIIDRRSRSGHLIARMCPRRRTRISRPAGTVP